MPADDSPATDELEIKYRSDDPQQFASLKEKSQLHAGFALDEATTTRVVDLYWDTDDFALLRGGFCLRIRHQRSHFQVTLKSTERPTRTGFSERVEIEEELSAQQIASLQSNRLPLSRLLASLRAGAQWPPAGWQSVLDGMVSSLERAIAHPLLCIEQNRLKRNVSCQDLDSSFAELSLDHVMLHEVEVGDGNWGEHCSEPKHGAPLAQWWELEIEAFAAAEKSRLQRLADELAHGGEWSPAPGNKLEEGLHRLAAVHSVQPEQTMLTALRRIWNRQMVELICNESGVRRDRDPEAVHALRVALRRMRAAEKLFGPHVGKRRLDPFHRIFELTADTLGAARELDVALVALDEQGPAERGDQQIQELRESWQESREQAYDTVIEWLTSGQYCRLLSELRDFCRIDPANEVADEDETVVDEHGRPAPRQVRHVMPTELQKRYAQVRAFETVLDLQASSDPAKQHHAPLSAGQPIRIQLLGVSTETLHALRIDGKRLRYCLEFVQHLAEPGQVGHLITLLEAVQDSLGAINDSAGMQRRLQAAGVAPAAENLLAAYYRSQAEIRAHHLAAFLPLWDSLRQVETRRQLAEIAAVL